MGASFRRTAAHFSFHKCFDTTQPRTPADFLRRTKTGLPAYGDIFGARGAGKVDAPLVEYRNSHTQAWSGRALFARLCKQTFSSELYRALTFGESGVNRLRDEKCAASSGIGPKVMPSFTSDIGFAAAFEDQGATKEAQECWSQRVSAFLNKRKRDDEEDKNAPPAKKRKKSAAWLACVDHVLKMCCGTGLEYYRISKEKRACTDPWSWPYLAITPDQGPDGLCASFYARYGQDINLEMFFDISHGVWRDQEGAVKAISLQGFTHLMVVAYNLCHSPWGSEARFCSLRESGHELLQGMNEHCGLFRRPGLVGAAVRVERVSRWTSPPCVAVAFVRQGGFGLHSFSHCLYGPRFLEGVGSLSVMAQCWSASRSGSSFLRTACESGYLRSFAELVVHGREAPLCHTSHVHSLYMCVPLLEATCVRPRRHFRDDLIADLGLADELVGLTEAEGCRVIKQRLIDDGAHHKKGAQVKMCRFANWVDRAIEYDKGWAWMLMRLVHYALHEGLLRGCEWEKLFQASGEPVEKKDDEKRVEVARSNDEVNRFRTALKNNVQLSLALLLDPSTRVRTRLLSSLVAPLRKWYGEQSCFIRSTPALLLFVRRQVEGGGGGSGRRCRSRSRCCRIARFSRSSAWRFPFRAGTRRRTSTTLGSPSRTGWRR